MGPGGERNIAGRDFFHGMLTTDLALDEIVTAIRLPPWPSKRRWAFKEFARRSGDFAITGVALHFEIREKLIHDARIVAFGVDEKPVILESIQTMLEGMAANEDTATKIGSASVNRAEVDPPTDAQGSADYRRSLLGVLVERALIEAINRRGIPV